MTTTLRGKASGARLAGHSSAQARRCAARAGQHGLLPRVAGAVGEPRPRREDRVAPGPQRRQPRRELARPALDAAELGARGGAGVDGDRAGRRPASRRPAAGLERCSHTVVDGDPGRAAGVRVGVDGRSLGRRRGSAGSRTIRAPCWALAAEFPDDEYRVLLPRGRGRRSPRGRQRRPPPAPRRASLFGAAAVAGGPRLDRLLGGCDVLWAPAPAPLALGDGVPFVLTVHDRSWELRPRRLHALRARVARARAPAPAGRARRAGAVRHGGRARRADRRVGPRPRACARRAAGPDSRGAPANRPSPKIPERRAPTSSSSAPSSRARRPTCSSTAFPRRAGGGLDADLVVAGDGPPARPVAGPGRAAARARRRRTARARSTRGALARRAAVVARGLRAHAGRGARRTARRRSSATCRCCARCSATRRALRRRRATRQALAEALLALARDPALRGRLLAAGRPPSRGSAGSATAAPPAPSWRRRPGGDASPSSCVLHDSAGPLPALLGSLARYAPAAQVVVVDTASPRRGRRRSPATAGAEVVALGANPGFGAANNAGRRARPAPVTVLLNPDCELLDDGLARPGRRRRAPRPRCGPRACSTPTAARSARRIRCPARSARCCPPSCTRRRAAGRCAQRVEPWRARAGRGPSAGRSRPAWPPGRGHCGGSDRSIPASSCFMRTWTSACAPAPPGSRRSSTRRSASATSAATRPGRAYDGEPHALLAAPAARGRGAQPRPARRRPRRRRAGADLRDADARARAHRRRLAATRRAAGRGGSGRRQPRGARRVRRPFLRRGEGHARPAAIPEDTAAARRDAARVELHELQRSDRDAFLRMVHESRELHRPWTYPPERADQFDELVARAAARRLRLPARLHRRRRRHRRRLHHLPDRPRLVPVGLPRLLRERPPRRQGADARGDGARARLRLRPARACTGSRRTSSPATRPRSRSPAAPASGSRAISPRYLLIGGQWRDHERYAITADEHVAQARAARTGRAAPRSGGAPRDLLHHAPARRPPARAPAGSGCGGGSSARSSGRRWKSARRISSIEGV